MPRQLTQQETLTSLREERQFTQARIEDEADLPPALAEQVAEWQPRIDAVLRDSDAFDDELSRTEAAIVGANYYLDISTQDFGDQLFLAAGKDTQAPRMKAFFNGMTPSAFKRQPFEAQIRATRAWFDAGLSDPVFEPHKERIKKYCEKGERALKRDAALPARRAALWPARETLTAWLTSQRDELHAELAKHARDQGYGREWAETFFPKGPTKAKKDEPKQPE